MIIISLINPEVKMSNNYAPNRWLGSLPKIGIRPTIDGRLGGVRESLESQTMGMTQRTADFLSANLRYPDGSPEDVRREVRERVETFKPYSGFTIAPSQYLLPEIPTENIVAMYEAAWEYAWLDK
jgi:hypothetical protein